MSEPAADTTARAWRAAIRDGGTTARDALEACLARIEAANPALNAFREITAERARARADAVDAGEISGPLAGVPVAVKDNLCTDFGTTTCCSRILEGFRSPYSATAVERLEAAGALVVGKTVMDEFAMGSSCEQSAAGACANPWDPERVPGGSSGGSAAAVAAGLCPLALGTDTGGSIRQPAAFCGALGLKPTYGRVSRWGLVAFASSLDQIGPIARSAEDAALLLDAIAGPDERDATCLPEPPPACADAVGAAPAAPRIGIPREYMRRENEAAVSDAVERAAERFRAAGAEIVDLSLPHTEYGIPTYYIVAPAEASSNLARYDGVRYGRRSPEAGDVASVYERSRAEGFGPEVQRRIMLGTFALSSGYHDAYYVRALKARRLIKRDFDAALTRCDAILCPTTPGVAFARGERTADPVRMYLSDIYTANANLAGLPAVHVPQGRSPEGLPVGVQLMAPAGAEPRLLGLAAALERAAGGPAPVSHAGR